MSEQHKFDEVVSALHEAMLDDGHLSNASRLIDEACGSVGNNIIIYRGDTQADFEWLFAKLHYRGEINEEINQIYPKHYRRIDERLPRFMRLPESQPIAVPEIYTPEELRTSPTFNELLDIADGKRGLNMRMKRGLLDGTRMFFILADPVAPKRLEFRRPQDATAFASPYSSICPRPAGARWQRVHVGADFAYLTSG